MGRITQPTVS